MTTQPPARPQVGSDGSGAVLREAPQPAPQPTEVQWRRQSTM